MGGSLNINEWFRRGRNAAHAPAPENANNAPPPPVNNQIPPSTFDRFSKLPQDIQDMIWNIEFPFYLDLGKRRIDVEIRIQPTYVPKTWNQPWYMYPRDYYHYVKSIPRVLVIDIYTLDEQLRFQAISQRTRSEFQRLYDVPLQLHNGAIRRIRSEDHSIFMDMTSLFCLYVYTRETEDDEFQMTGYDQIRTFMTDAGLPEFEGLRNLQEGRGRPFSGVTSSTAQVRPAGDTRNEDQVLRDAVLQFTDCYIPQDAIFPLGDRTRYKLQAETMVLNHRVDWRNDMLFRFFEP